MRKRLIGNRGGSDGNFNHSPINVDTISGITLNVYPKRIADYDSSVEEWGLAALPYFSDSTISDFYFLFGFDTGAIYPINDALIHQIPPVENIKYHYGGYEIGALGDLGYYFVNEGFNIVFFYEYIENDFWGTQTTYYRAVNLHFDFDSSYEFTPDQMDFIPTNLSSVDRFVSFSSYPKDGGTIPDAYYDYVSKDKDKYVETSTDWYTYTRDGYRYYMNPNDTERCRVDVAVGTDSNGNKSCYLAIWKGIIW